MVQIKFCLLLSLKEMALRRVAASLWSDPDILSCDIWELSGVWKKRFEDPIKDKIMELEIPKALKDQLTDLVRPISIEVMEWRRSHQELLVSVCKVGAPVAAKLRLCWTSAGTIDYEKTAKELVRCEEINSMFRYEIACYYCFEDYLSIYWAKLSEEMKMKFAHLSKSEWPDLPQCWSFILQRKQSKLVDHVWRPSFRNLANLNQFLFERSASLRRKTAAIYFLPKLTFAERETSLRRSLASMLFNRNQPQNQFREKYSDVLLFLLSEMSAEQRMEAIKRNAIEILLCFLQWPLQDLFSENADLFWPHVPSSNYPFLIEKIMIGYHAPRFYFPKMFKVLITQWSQEFKLFFIEGLYTSARIGTRVAQLQYMQHNMRDTPACYFLDEFFKEKDSQSIKTLFRTLDISDRRKIVENEYVVKLLGEYLATEDCEFVELCLQEATLHKENKQMFKTAFLKCLETRIIQVLAEKSIEKKIDSLFSFLDETDTTSDELKRGEKRKIED